MSQENHQRPRTIFTPEELEAIDRVSTALKRIAAPYDLTVGEGLFITTIEHNIADLKRYFGEQAETESTSAQISE